MVPWIILAKIPRLNSRLAYLHSDKYKLTCLLYNQIPFVSTFVSFSLPSSLAIPWGVLRDHCLLAMIYSHPINPMTTMRATDATTTATQTGTSGGSAVSKSC